MVLVLGSGRVSASEQKLTRVRLSEVVRSIFYAPQYVAIEKGFFTEEGLNIDLSTAWAHKGAVALTYRTSFF